MKYLLLIPLFVGAWVLIPAHHNPPVTQINPPAPTQTASKPAFTTEGLLTLTNQLRTQDGLGTLAETITLDNSAHLKCVDMETRNYWAHNINGENFYQFDPPAQKIGENLSKGYLNDSGVLYGWENSPEHRANLLDPQFTLVGFAFCDGPQHNLVVQELET